MRDYSHFRPLPISDAADEMAGPCEPSVSQIYKSTLFLDVMYFVTCWCLGKGRRGVHGVLCRSGAGSRWRWMSAGVKCCQGSGVGDDLMSRLLGNVQSPMKSCQAIVTSFCPNASHDPNIIRFDVFKQKEKAEIWQKAFFFFLFRQFSSKWRPFHSPRNCLTGLH